MVVLYDVLFISSTGKSKRVGTYGKLTSAHTVVNTLTERTLRRYKRKMIGAPTVTKTTEGNKVHTFIQLKIKAHQFRNRNILRHYVVEEKPIKSYQVPDVEVRV